MGRLIDAEKLIEIFKASMNTAKETFDIDLICEAIGFSPIAYDVDAVVHQMEAVKEKYRIQFLADHSMKERMLNSEREQVMSIAIEIVKDGCARKPET